MSHQLIQAREPTCCLQRSRAPRKRRKVTALVRSSEPDCQVLFVNMGLSALVKLLTGFRSKKLFRFSDACADFAYQMFLTYLLRTTRTAPDAQAKPSSQAVDAATSVLRQQVLDSKSGLPVLRKRVDFNELLRDVRQGRVDRVEYIDSAQYKDNWAKDPASWNIVDGSCLVVYHDGRVAYVRPSAEHLQTNK